MRAVGRMSGFLGSMVCLALAAGVLVLPACSLGMAGQRCRAGEQRVVDEMLYFGTARPGGTVGADEWRAFVDEEIAKRLPDGFTTWDALGQSRGATGNVEREDSHVLQVIHAHDASTERALDEVVALYRKRFAQESVLRVRSRACASIGR